ADAERGADANVRLLRRNRAENLGLQPNLPQCGREREVITERSPRLPVLDHCVDEITPALPRQRVADRTEGDGHERGVRTDSDGGLAERSLCSLEAVEHELDV